MCSYRGCGPGSGTRCRPCLPRNLILVGTAKGPAPQMGCRASCGCGSDRRRSGDLSIFSRTLYQLSYRAERPSCDGRSDASFEDLATLTGLEPATSAVTGRRANQLRYRAVKRKRSQGQNSTRTYLVVQIQSFERTPNGIRTRAAAVKGRCPRPLDDGGLVRCAPRYQCNA